MVIPKRDENFVTNPIIVIVLRKLWHCTNNFLRNKEFMCCGLLCIWCNYCFKFTLSEDGHLFFFWGGGWSEVYCLAIFSNTLEIKKMLFSWFQPSYNDQNSIKWLSECKKTIHRCFYWQMTKIEKGSNLKMLAQVTLS